MATLKENNERYDELAERFRNASDDSACETILSDTLRLHNTVKVKYYRKHGKIFSAGFAVGLASATAIGALLALPGVVKVIFRKNAYRALLEKVKILGKEISQRLGRAYSTPHVNEYWQFSAGVVKSIKLC
jgi:hypothetical protein